jgi:hypothetical protein
MFDTATHAPKATFNRRGFPSRTGFSISKINRLERADFSRDANLLAASIAGVVLGLNPRDSEMRERASLAWNAIRAALADHVLTEEASILPWSGDLAVGSETACELLTKRYLELRSLARTIDSISFSEGSDDEVSTGGKALCRLAVKLEDLMDGRERRLVDQLGQYVFSSAPGTQTAA